MGGSDEATREVADAIELYVMCKTFHTLPHSGGLLDQDCYNVWLLKIVKFCFDQKEARDNERAKLRR